MATCPLPTRLFAVTHRLVPFLPQHAHRVAAWSRSAGETLWLAPRTPPPITAEKVVGWAAPGRQQLSLIEGETGLVVGYGELNALNLTAGEYWLGHLVIDPLRRGQRLGLTLTRLLIQRAAMMLAARRISLVVFPENSAAVNCYRAAGLRFEAYEEHEFPVYGRRVRLARMAIAM